MQHYILTFLLFLSTLSAQGSLTLVKTVPATDSKGISLSTKIVLQFSEEVVLGTGSCQLNGTTLAPTIASKYVTFQPNSLEYLTQYTFTIPVGMFKNKSGEAFVGDTFAFTTQPRPLPTSRVYDAVVAADGSGNYKTVQQAINAMPDNSTQPWLVFVKNGIYDELVRVPATKAKLHLIGQDKEKTIIQYKINYAGSSSDLGWEFSNIRLGVADGSTLVVDAPDFYTENISYINSWGYGQKSGPQALALISNGDRIVVNNCKLLSYQDTWKTTSNSSNRGYVKNAFIEGAVDFIYSAGDYYFDKCTLNINRTAGGYIVAPSHDASTKWGYIFMSCSIIAPTLTSVYFGRPWHNAPKTSFVNTTLGKNLSIYPTGWVEKMGGIPAIFADYNTRNYLGEVVDLSQRNNYYWFTDGTTGLKVEGYAQKTLTPEQVASYTIRNVLSGTDTWHPDEKTVLLESPDLHVQADKLSWNSIPYSICFAITRNDSIVGFTKDTTYVLTQPGAYKLQTVNEYGGLSNFSATVTKTVSKIPEIKAVGPRMYVLENQLHVEGLHSEGLLQLYTLNGVLLHQETLHEDAIRTMNTQKACLIKFSNKQGIQTLKYFPNCFD